MGYGYLFQSAPPGNEAVNGQSHQRYETQSNEEEGYEPNQTYCLPNSSIKQGQKPDEGNQRDKRFGNVQITPTSSPSRHAARV